jgi:hypothetical protein
MNAYHSGAQRTAGESMSDRHWRLSHARSAGQLLDPLRKLEILAGIG